MSARPGLCGGQPAMVVPSAISNHPAHRMSGQAHRYHFLLSGSPVEQRIAKLNEAISESHMGHLS